MRDDVTIDVGPVTVGEPLLRPAADAATSPDETEREQLAEAIDRVIGGWLATRFGIARAAWSLPRPDQMSIEWVGHQALDQAQYLHLAGWQASLTPKLVELIDRRGADLEQLRAELAVLRPIRDRAREVASRPPGYEGRGTARYILGEDPS